jgi:hypothetical protein
MLESIFLAFLNSAAFGTPGIAFDRIDHISSEQEH